MTTEESPAPSWGRGLTRSRGASGWRLKIYDALYEADMEGRTLSFQELVDECVERFNRSGTMQWWGSFSSDKPQLDSIRDYRLIVIQKVRLVNRQMIAAREIANLGTRKNPLYTIADPPNPPKYWHPKTYRPGHFKEYVPARADPQMAKAARRMDSGWFADVRAELAKPRPRSERLKELLQEGLDIFTSG